VSRLVGGDHFELFNGGRAISGSNDAQTPDITFSGFTPYVTWIQKVNGIDKVVIGHFDPTGTFIKDNTGGAPAGAAIPFRSALSSSCTANPSVNSSACPADAAGTPFNLVTQAGSPQGLFAESLAPTRASTGPATNITSSGATLNGQVNPGGARVKFHFDFLRGRCFAGVCGYGSRTPVQWFGPADTVTPLSAELTGEPLCTTHHFRLSVSSDFTTITGRDNAFTTSCS
jgi:hypothetical protein